jgi:hypothetical protein
VILFCGSEPSSWHTCGARGELRRCLLSTNKRSESGKSSNRGHDDERTIVSDDLLERGRERVFQRSLSEEDITRLLPEEAQHSALAKPRASHAVPQARASSAVPQARASAVPQARASAVPQARASAVPQARASAPPPRISNDDEESTQIFDPSKGGKLRDLAAELAAPSVAVPKKNTLLNPAPIFGLADDDGDATLMADHAALSAAPVKSAPPPAFARRPEPELQVTAPAPFAPSRPSSAVPTPAASAGSLAVSVSATPIERTHNSKTAYVRDRSVESRRSMLPWAASLAAALALAIGGSVVTMKNRAAATASASFVDPRAGAIAAASPAPELAPVATPDAPVPVVAAPVIAVAAPLTTPDAPPAPVAANPQPAPVAANPQPVPVAANPQPVTVNEPAPAAQPVAAPIRPQPQARPVAQAPRPQPVAGADRPAPVERPTPVAQPTPSSKKKGNAGGMSDEEKRASDEARRLADKQLEQSL